MFQFTTTHVINSNYDSTGLPLWSVGDYENEAGETKSSLHIKGVNNFKEENVVAVYKADYIKPENELIKIDLGAVDGTKGDTFRINLYIRLTQADQSSYYANDTQYKGRPFTVEFPWMEDAEKTIENLKKLIKKYGLLVFEKEVVKVSSDGTTLVLDAVNEFQRFHIAKLEKFVESDKPFAEIWEEVEGAVEVSKYGVEGFGTYGWILRNLKLPTYEHTRPFAPKAEEMPIPGAKYDQYTIHYCAKRGPLGLNAVGDVVKSVTTHVFFVNQALANDAEVEGFEAALAKIADIKPAKNPGQYSVLGEVSSVDTTDVEDTEVSE